ncbi:MAG: phospho-N-acetylmuramoyl-pentapeptide-transferase [Desulfobacterales bacterium]|nr:phospho-N-acetylmuramoyl-pentapeptide-transferase [Desulfobacterales bacterium]
MLYHLMYALHAEYTIFNVFKYITFRTIYAGLTAFLLVLIFGPWVIRRLSQLQIGQYIRDDGPKTHFNKAGTPTMGGILIMGSIVLSTVLWTDLTNIHVWIVLFSMIGFSYIGFKDDYLKQVEKGSKGLSAKDKFRLQIGIAFLTSCFIYFFTDFDTRLSFPFFKQVKPDIGFLYIFFATFVIVGTSNAVNLTDGLDGLAIGPVNIAAVSFLILTYVAGHAKIAEYLQIPYVKGVGELSIVCGIIAGSGLGFLWFNTHPAEVFMGDVGSLPLGALLGTIAVMAKQEIMLVLVGGLFVMEALSVIIQVGFFKLTHGRRIFRMAPLHHHFEKKGWKEEKVTVRFWIIAIILALISVSTLKLR